MLIIHMIKEMAMKYMIMIQNNTTNHNEHVLFAVAI